ncbi:MAG: InlB B-repeat-containing protein [Clostridiales bacterium]|jgi:uncharacterized repeat protein (TIGR02543 family)|nr:InlB B-repeat-containing protein [Clostridiales bacterium]
MSGSNYKKGGIIVLASVALTVCFSMFLLASNFKRSVYTVVFDPDGGSSVEAYIGVEEGRVISAPEVPVKEGFAFTGWFKDKELTSEWVFETEKVRRDTLLYAGWTVQVFGVGFYGGAHSEGDRPIVLPTPYTIQYVSYGETLTNPGTPEENGWGTRIGHDFDGWYIYNLATLRTARPAENDLTRIEEERVLWDFKKGVYEPMNLYAGWKAHEYKVGFYNGEGKYYEAEVEYGKKVPNPRADDSYTDPYIEGMRFSGWYTAENESGVLWDFNAAYTFDKDTVLYAKFEQIYFTATYNFIDGTSSSETVPYGGTFTAPEKPVRTGVGEFYGWCERDGTGFAGGRDFNLSAKKDLDLFEVWEITIEYEGYAEWNKKTLSGLKAEEYNPEKEGSVFTGWYTDSALTEKWNFDDKVNGNLKLYPGFKLIEHTVTFYNGGKLYAEEHIYYGETFAIQAPPPPGENGFFGGWYIEDENGRYKIPDGYVVKSDITLTAVWWNDDSIAAAPVEDIRAFYREKLVKEAEKFSGWQSGLAWAAIVVFDVAAAAAGSYGGVKTAYDTAAAAIGLL